MLHRSWRSFDVLLLHYFLLFALDDELADLLSEGILLQVVAELDAEFEALREVEKVKVSKDLVMLVIDNTETDSIQNVLV